MGNTDLKIDENELVAEEDEEIAAIDSDYDPNQSDSDTEPDNAVPPICNDKVDVLHADASRQQAGADHDMDDYNDSDSNDDDSSNEADDPPPLETTPKQKTELPTPQRS